MDSLEHLVKKNRLLNAVGSELAPLLPQMEALFLNSREVVNRQGAPITFVYFPVTAVLTMIASTSDGETVEVATVGSEGLVGVTALLSSPQSRRQQGALTKVITHVPGSVIRMKAEVFESEMERNIELNRCVRRYLNVLFTQLVLSVGCNRLHSLEQRCARWLLSSMDRNAYEEIAVTQELLAEMLGVRRQSVDNVLGELESKRLIECLRGSIKINDPKGLSHIACECYDVAKERLDNFLH
jgi:CRP-like cAMP-binding protein